MSAAALQWRKEFRELLPLWAATAIGLLTTWALMHPDAMPTDALYRWASGFHRHSLFLIGLGLYTTGTIVLGALPIGQEYAHRTLAGLLAQPIRRSRLLTAKLGTLALLLMLLGALAVGIWETDPLLVSMHGREGLALSAALPLLAAFCLAPWFTMVCRGTIGGVVLTMALPVILWVVLGYFHAPLMARIATVVVAVTGMTMTWRTFHRLEAMEGHQSEVDLMKWFAPSTTAALEGRRQNPVWLQIKKELRLQQGTFFISAIYLALCVMILLSQRLRFAGIGPHDLFPVVFLQNCLVPVVAGACACAEERRLGTADWHALLPGSLWRQWVVKVSVTVGLTFALVIVPTQILDAVSPENLLRNGMESAVVVVLCIAAIYVSSLTTSAMRAVVMTGPAIAAAAWLAVSVLWPIASVFQELMFSAGRALRPVIELSPGSRPSFLYGAMLAAAAGLSVLLLALGYANHRTVDRNPWRIARQVAWLAVFWVGGNLLVFLVMGLIPTRL